MQTVRRPPSLIAHFSNRPVLTLFILLGALYLITYRGNIDVIDEAEMMGVTANLVDAHTLQINSIYPALLPWGAPAVNPDTPIYAKYAPGQSFLALPFYALGSLIPIHAAKTLNGQPYALLAPFLLALLINTLATLLTALAIFRTVPLWGYYQRTAALITVLYAITTLAWPYAKTFYSEPTTACALAWTVYFAIRCRLNCTARDGLAAGISLGLAILLRATSVLLVPLLLLYLLPRWRLLFASLIGPAMGIVLTLGYNLARFGSITESGYEPGFGRAPWEALLGFLISPSRSFFLFNPVLLLIIPGAWLLWRTARQTRPDILLIIGMILAQVAIYSAWWAWDSGQSLGPRFLVPAIPLACLLVAPLVERPRWRVALVVLAAAGFGLQILGNLANPNDVFFETINQQHVTLPEVNWQLAYSIPANLWTAYSRHSIDSLALRYLPPQGAAAKALVFVILASVLSALMIILALRIGIEDHPDRPPLHPSGE